VRIIFGGMISLSRQLMKEIAARLIPENVDVMIES